MPEDAIIHLDTVRCISEWDRNGHSEPYFWPVLLYSNDALITSQEFVAATAPALSHFRDLVKDGMKAGDVADVPAGQRTLRVFFEDNQQRRVVSLVVAFFEEDDTPDDAARAGYGRFDNAIVEEIANFVAHNFRAPDPDNPAEMDPTVAAVRAKVESAARAELSWWEKLQIALGNLKLDDQLGFKVWTAPGVPGSSSGIVPGPFTMHFSKTETVIVFGPFGQTTTKQVTNEYEIAGRLELHSVVVDRCAAQVAEVRRARSVLDGIEAEIAELQAELHGGGEQPPLPKAAIIAEIRRIRAEEIPPALRALEAAQAALNQCRRTPTRFTGTAVLS